jgi:preprotein translocase subunit SecD
MPKNLRIKAVIILAVILASIYGLIGIPKSKAELISNWEKNIRLGLDLKGGSYLVLQVQVQDAFRAEAAQVVERLKDELNKASITYSGIDNTEPNTIETADQVQVNIRGVNANQVGTLRSIVSDRLPNWILASTTGNDYRLTMRPSEALALRKATIENSIRTIENRVNALGIAETGVQQRGSSEGDPEILVQLPGVDDPARIRSLIQETAMLELYEVKDGPFASEDEARAKHGGVLPLNTKLIKGANRGGQDQGWLLVARNPVIHGSDLRDARPAQGELGKWETNFTLTQDAAKRFERFTEANIGNRLAIVMDNQYRSAPTIQNKISDNGRITGAANQQEASDLALVLRAGSLPASLKQMQESTVGPSLGADSISRGLTAGIAGVIAVVIVMLAYYRRAGINATLALVLNAIILLAVLSYFDAVLTLPGIAGVILTIGMAVDSNVLIFERIREELRAGKAVPAAIETGFSKAFATIIDTHVTTVVSCAFLFLFGTGPVKGFAVTLVIGLLANVFTAVFVSKFIFDWELSGQRQVTTLSI